MNEGRYLIREIKRRTLKGQEDTKVIIASIGYERDGEALWLHAVGDGEGVTGYILPDDISDKFERDGFYDRDYARELRQHAKNTVNRVDLGGTYDSILFDWFTGARLPEPDETFLRLMFTVLRCSEEELEDLKAIASGRFTDEIEIPYSDKEIEYWGGVVVMDRMYLDGTVKRETYEKYKARAAEGDRYAHSELALIELIRSYYYHDEAGRARAMLHYEEAIRLGEGSAATFLGSCYLDGDYGFPVDREKALSMFKKGMELGDKIGKDAYEKMMQQVEEDWTEDWEDEDDEEEDEEEDDEEILAHLGELLGLDKWSEEAEEAEEAAEDEDGEEEEEDEEEEDVVEEQGGFKSFEGDLTPENYQLLRSKAEAGDPVAIYELGMVEIILGSYDGDEKRKESGMQYLLDAAGKGCGAAASYIGTIYHEGKFGYPADMDKAMSWYRKGAEMGDPLGMSNYAIGLQRGEGSLFRDDEEAFRWLKTAADAGLGIAACNAALALHAGRGVKMNRKLAKKYFKKAARRGIAMAQMWLYSEDYKD